MAKIERSPRAAFAAMKIFVRLDVSDRVRRAIATETKCATTHDGLARMRPMVKFLEERITQSLPSLERFIPAATPRARLTDADRRMLVKVYDWMHSMGATDDQIEEWILLQRARLELATLFPHVRKSQQDAGTPVKV